MLKKVALSAAIGGMAVFAVGCAITDYDGWAAHMTQSEAKLWGSEVAFSSFLRSVRGYCNRETCSSTWNVGPYSIPID